MSVFGLFSFLGAGCVAVTPVPPTPRIGGDSFAFVADVNYPDGSVVNPGSVIDKSWRIRNSSDKTWEGYKLIRIYGKGVDEVPIPTVQPGQEVTVTARIEVPVQDYIAIYNVANADDLSFSEALYVLLGSTTVVTELPPTAPVLKDDRYCVDVETIDPGTTAIEMAHGYTGTVNFTNCGSEVWLDVKLVPVYGKTAHGSPVVDIPTTPPGQSVIVEVVTFIPPDWPFAYAHNIRQMAVQIDGTIYRFGQPMVSYWPLKR